MAEPILNSPCVVPLIRKCVSTGVPQHVGVNFEGEAGALANALDQPINGIRREWSASLRLEDVASRGLALEFAKGAQLVAADRMRRRLAILGTADVQRGGAPAMAAKVTERLWEIGDIVDVLEAWEAAGARVE